MNTNKKAILVVSFGTSYKETREKTIDAIENEIKNKLDSNNIESPFLNKQQACKYLGIANNTLDSWIKKGLPVIRVGKTVRFDKTELNYWLQNQ